MTGFPALRRWGVITTILAIGLTLPACASRVSTRSLVLAAGPEVNDQTPVAVELVLVRDRSLAETVGGLTARGWFETRDQLERDHPGALRVHRWELVPDQVVEVPFPFRDRRGVAAFIFANYLSPGAHRARIDDRRRLTLHLGREAFSVADGH